MDSVRVAQDEQGIATVSLNCPERHNAFDDQLIAHLTEQIECLGAQEAVRGLILTGEGKSFSAGADLNWMQRMADYSQEENFADSLKLANLMHVLNECPKPTIAAVQGSAFGGGVGLVACCDMAIAVERASFCLSEVRLGLIPAAISPYVVAAIGERAARRYFLTAERFSAQEAKRIGLLHEVVADQALLKEMVHTLMAACIKGGPEALQDAKTLIKDVAYQPVDENLRIMTAERIAKARSRTEGREGIAAFLEKRSPNWVTSV